MAKKKKKKIKSHVKRLKLQQQKNPMSPAKYRKKLRVARRKDFFRNFSKAIIIVCVVFLALFGAANLLLYKSTGETLFSCMTEAREIVEAGSKDDFRYAQTSYIYSSDGTKIAELAEDTDATYLTYDEIPADVVNAFVAVEDRTFWTNGGIDYKGIVRVCLNYIRTKGEVAEGASTITQQLARGAYLSNEKTMLRKVKEIFIARELTKKYSKEQIMEFYCNTCCFANGIYGVEDAAEKYFDKSVDDLTLSEAAYICAIPNRPEYYNPLKESQNAVTRRDKILDDMQECGYITADACTEAKSQQIALTSSVEEEETFYNYETTYAINCAVRYLMEKDGFEFQYNFDSEDAYTEYNKNYDEAYSQAKHELYTGGYEVYTTIDLKAQEELQNILDEKLAFSDATVDSGIYELQGAMTVIDNDNGKVVAIIGGRSQEEIANTYSLNRAYQSYAQPGSSFKPLAVYAPALDNGYSESSELTNIDVTEAKKKKDGKISDMDGNQMTLRSAVEHSTNGCAYWLFNEITPSLGLSYVTNMNFSRIVPSDYNLSAALGGLTHGASTVEMANAYYTLENHGEYAQTDCIDSIIDANGDNIYTAAESKTVYSKEAADEMTDILEGVISQQYTHKMKWYSSSDTAAAGKTGTTNDNTAGWFCGYTPYYTIAVWVGCDELKTVDNLTGGTYPAYIWKAAMLYLIDDLPTAKFDLEDSYSKTREIETDDEEEEMQEDPVDTETPDTTGTVDGADTPTTEDPVDTIQGTDGTNGSSTGGSSSTGGTTDGGISSGTDSGNGGTSSGTDSTGGSSTGTDSGTGGSTDSGNGSTQSGNTDLK